MKCADREYGRGRPGRPLTLLPNGRSVIQTPKTNRVQPAASEHQLQPLLGLMQLAAVSIHRRVRCGRVFRICHTSAVPDSGVAGDPEGDTYSKVDVDGYALISPHMRG